MLPSVVRIDVSSQSGSGSGSGIILTADGQILTNNHVVEGAGQGGTLRVSFQDGTTAEAEVLGTTTIAEELADTTPETATETTESDSK